MVLSRFSDRAPGHIPHSVHPMGLQLIGIALAHPPEVGEGPVVPEEPPVGHLIQLGDAHSVLVRMDVLGHDVHSHLGQVQIGTHARCGGEAGGFQNVQDDGSGQLPGGHLISVQVVGQIHEHLVDGVGIDVLRGHIFQIDAVYLGAPVDIVGHPGRGHDVV